MNRGRRPPMISPRAWREIGELLERQRALQPITAALNAEAVIDTEARHRAADELDAQGEHEAAALLRR